jgi:WD40 repeat protein
MDKLRFVVGFLIGMWVLVASLPTQITSGESLTGYRFKLDWHPSEDRLAVVDGSQVDIYSLDLHRIASYDCQCEQVALVEWSSTGNYMAIATDDAHIQIIDTVTLSLLRDIPAYDPTFDGEINYLVWHPHQDIFAASGGDFVNVDTIKVFDAEDGDMLHKFEEDEDIVAAHTTAMVWSPTGNYLAVASGNLDVHVRVWAFVEGELLWDFRDFFDPNNTSIVSIVFTIDERLVIAGGWTGLTEFNMLTGERQASLEEVTIISASIDINRLRAIARSPDVTGTTRNEYLFETSMGGENIDITFENIGDVSAYDWNFHSSSLATFSNVDHVLRIWDIGSQQLVIEHVTEAFDENVDIAWNAAGNAIAIITSDGHLDIIQV